MIRNYLQVALRNLLKNKLHTLINIFGLAAGMASVFLIALYIQHELSYDRFHNHPEDLYRIIWHSDNSQTRTPHPMAQALVADFPEVQSAVSLTPLYAAGLTRETHSLKNPARDQRYDESNLLAVDTTFFDVFDFPLIRGDKSGLKNLRGVYLSESMAKKYFGDEDPLGKQLAVDSSNYLVEVVGVFRDVPENSHFHFDLLGSYVREKSFDPGNRFYTWEDFGHYNYIRLKPGTNAKELEAKLMPWMRKYLKGTEEVYASLVERKYGFKLPAGNRHTFEIEASLGTGGQWQHRIHLHSGRSCIVYVNHCMRKLYEFIDSQIGRTSQGDRRTKNYGCIPASARVAVPGRINGQRIDRCDSVDDYH
ncbi:MAG: ABC transporter permease [Chryseolinea sp.]